jgi:hypothetical protein
MMIWVILVFLGVPLWLCALGIMVIVFRSRGLKQRYGDIPVRVRRSGQERWTRGHAIWVSDVFAWRGSPAAWKEDLAQVVAVSLRDPDPEERKKLHRLGEGFAIATLLLRYGETLEVAARPEQHAALLGPLEPVSEPA